MTNSEYYHALLLDQRWKAKRKWILKRDQYKCTVCNSKEDIQVHHSFYYKGGAKPWEYPNSSLYTLCRRCHFEYHEHCEVEIRDRPTKKPAKKPQERKKKMRRKKRNGSVHHNKQKILSLAEMQSIRIEDEGKQIRKRAQIVK